MLYYIFQKRLLLHILVFKFKVVDNQYVRNGSLTICVDIKIFTESSSVYQGGIVPLSDDGWLSTDLKQFRENMPAADVILNVDGTIIPAHKAMLIARSEVFAAMFSSGMTETNEGKVI